MTDRIPFPMTSADAIRAEVGNQLIQSLRRLSQDAWAQAERVAIERQRTFTLAYRLSHDAMALMAEELGEDTHALLLTQLAHVDRFMELDAAAPLSKEKETRQRIARGVVIGAFLRGTRGFNVGAFRELAVPFADCIDFTKVDAVARNAHRLDAGDFSARGPVEWQTPVLRVQRPRSA